MKKKFVMLIIVALTILGACSHNETEEGGHTAHERLPNGDIQEATSSTNELPTFLDEHNQDMKNIYLVAAKHQELLEHIPCYCGCSLSANHKDNYDCFIHENRKDGSIVWDNHGTKCQVCVDIAAESAILYNQGKSIKDIREYIDEKYKEGFAEPTPTPGV
ncbi:PCYCGC motif-containing (lipo)protein [Ornithinibacillus xuwenensis]|uniref:PCYCGC motif-containing (Lipo)protein n=1 Tax=Ornithinibacillus xuwenensis TaxID=3144668 RepID=A0ABU9XGW9_9BACI